MFFFSFSIFFGFFFRGIGFLILVFDMIYFLRSYRSFPFFLDFPVLFVAVWNKFLRKLSFAWTCELSIVGLVAFLVIGVSSLNRFLKVLAKAYVFFKLPLDLCFIDRHVFFVLNIVVIMYEIINSNKIYVCCNKIDFISNPWKFSWL